MDIQLKMPPGTVFLAVVQPGVSHANIKGIDYSEAEKMPGVIKVITAKDVKGSNRIILPVTHARSMAPGTERPILADKKVFRYGDVVALVAADTEEHAREAAKVVKPDLEILPEYMSYLDAAMPDATRIHEEFPNLFVEAPVLKGKDTRDVMEASEYVVEGSFRSSRQPHLVLEPESVQAYMDEEGRVTVHSKSLAIWMDIFMLSPGLGIAAEKLRMIENPTGASFGCSASPANIGLAAVATMALNGVPVSLTMSYEEHQHFTGKRLPSYSNARLAADKEGKITALEFDFGWDKGAYTDLGDHYLVRVLRLICWPYNVPNVRGLSRMSISNHNDGVPYRAAGAVQSFTCGEAIVDILAEKIGMDPFEFRYKNVARPGDLTNNSYPFKEYPFEGMMDRMRPLYDDAVARAKAEDTFAKKRGVGLSWGGFLVAGGIDHAEVALELNTDGAITHYNTWEDQGQGSDVGSVVHTHEALRSLGYAISPQQIKLVQADTAQAPDSGPAAGNRSHYMIGNATLDAAKKLVSAMRKDNGGFRTYEEMISEGIPTKYLGVYDTAGLVIDYDPDTGIGDPAPENNYGLFLSEVEVDAATGKTTVLSMTVVYDVGVVGCLQAVEGQAYGGMSHSLGFALSEQYEDVKKHTNIAVCGIPYIKDVPDNLTAISFVSPRKTGPHGSAGCAEMLQSAGHMAIINAINNAAGVRIYELPATPEKVKEAMDAKAAGKDLTPKKYFLGSDLFDALEGIAENPKGTAQDTKMGADAGHFRPI
ncbi:MAG: xanthine dehydrogenase family protein molybdopterin-binding subunit [Clostridiales Family XIII bacterium]|jgi:aldehyde oxidoreductase|nr:xanthine dehydrogenase family protein molybdopterin-binding subunit [Clostridiales Family XIII bacterium]